MDRKALLDRLEQIFYDGTPADSQDVLELADGLTPRRATIDIRNVVEAVRSARIALLARFDPKRTPMP